MQARNELRPGPAPLKQFYDLLHGRLPFLGHIKMNTVCVVEKHTSADNVLCQLEGMLPFGRCTCQITYIGKLGF